ncbi:hypothetical protein MRB53_020401 [Persea americana]|uniref:Uncharacterized protein n=1 Tax=Persea americana TaxID=3435 RepID=A0ACC2L0W2_PERAE|nr:hypothetical protein MRB53_020401 [Persea americana]
MKQAVKRQRILILALLSFSVLAPIFFIPKNFSYFASSREFLEEISGIKYTGDPVELSAIQKETDEGLKELAQIDYDDREYKSRVSDNTWDDSTEEDDGLLERNALGIENGGERKDQLDREPLLYRGKEQLRNPSQTTSGGEPNGRPQSQRADDVKVRELKDQLIRAKVYLGLAPPTSKSHLVKELKLRIKELERAVGGATKDSDLSRRALQRMGSMDLTLSKASQVYPDCSAIESKLHAMTRNAEDQLITDYYSLQPDGWEFPNRERLHQPDLYHYAVFSDNVLACAVVVNSTISSAVEPEKIVFHVVTDALNLPAIRMWFVVNPPGRATISIESMDDFKWLPSDYNSMSKKENSQDRRYTSRLNYLRFYLPEVFPNLDKVVLLDHDVVVQRDLSGLWSVDMKGKVNGAVETFEDGETSNQMDMFVNISDSTLAKMFDVNARTWAFGMNLFDLKEWRRKDLTDVYHKWLKLGKRRQLWKAGILPLGLFTFHNMTVALDRDWHVLGLGYDSGVGQEKINRAAVIHYNGNMKPWLEIGIRKYRGYWTRFVKYDHPYLQQCNIHE